MMKTAIDFLKGLPAQLWVLLLAIVVGFLFYQLQEEKAKNKSMTRKVDILDKGFEAQRKKTENEIDSLEKVINLQGDFIRESKADIEELDRTKADINTKADDEKTDIGRIRDIDSLRNAVTRFYRP